MKTKNYVGLLLGPLLLLLLGACQNSPPAREAWVPVMEQTGFEFLNHSGERIQKALQASRTQLVAGRNPEALTSLADAENMVRVLLYYDVPMTEVRQLVYDAGRLHALQRREDALHYLDSANVKLADIERHGSVSVQTLMQETRSMVDSLRALLDEERRATAAKDQVALSRVIAAKFEELGHKVNLLALKSDMVLAGTDFHDDPDVRQP